jgi:nicotinate-nucleotide adenylyltransferase
MKIGVLGGTFDPVHRGHVAMAEEARKELEIEEMLMMPAGRPMSKVEEPIATAGQRLEMLRMAVAARPHLKVSTMEMERPGPSYTVDTLAELKKKYGENAGIYFVLGWDSLAQLPEWREPGGIVARCHLVAVPRPGLPRPSLDVLEKKLPGISKKVIFMDRPRLDISASSIREMIARGDKIDRLVPKSVAEYIIKHKLYTK